MACTFSIANARMCMHLYVCVCLCVCMGKCVKMCVNSNLAFMHPCGPGKTCTVILSHLRPIHAFFQACLVNFYVHLAMLSDKIYDI